jgi:osmotically-inducible protein OsmY
MGPKMIDPGFRDIAGRIRLLLAESPIAEVRRVSVEQDGDRVLLQGRVRTYYAKQMAQETVRRAKCGLYIVNSVSVD